MVTPEKSILQHADEWRQLFAPDDPAGDSIPIVLDILRRGGEPFLLLPTHPTAAARALTLYPAQASKARFAKRILEAALKLGLKPGLTRTELSVSAGNPFLKFLNESANHSEKRPSLFAILAGNPRVPGRRFILLTFDFTGKPLTVVKAGVSAAAHELLSKEEVFLQSVPATMTGLPKLRGAFHSETVRAFALDYIPGSTPTVYDPSPLSKLLNAWVATDKEVRLSEVAAWNRLWLAEAQSPLSETFKTWGDIRFRPALVHGDFTPWNVKVAANQWTTLDWERGELLGVPAWDWIHFVLQPALLVRHESAPELFHRLEQLLTAPEFLHYAERAGIRNHLRELALVFLAYGTRITRQTEGLEVLCELERIATAKWFPKS